MKKIAGVIAILLSIILFLIIRQWTNSHTRTNPPKESVPGILQENILISSLLIQ